VPCAQPVEGAARKPASDEDLHGEEAKLSEMRKALAAVSFILAAGCLLLLAGVLSTWLRGTGDSADSEYLEYALQTGSAAFVFLVTGAYGLREPRDRSH
jgi:hypothetical protein